MVRRSTGSTRQPELVPSAWFEDRFGEWLRVRMAERGVTQRMVALRSGVSHSTISRLIDRDRRPSLSTALALLRVLGSEPAGSERIIREDTG